eukprot:1159014-Pelagomonas_calceolata.AAC.17
MHRSQAGHDFHGKRKRKEKLRRQRKLSLHQLRKGDTFHGRLTQSVQAQRDQALVVWTVRWNDVIGSLVQTTQGT